MKDTAAIYKHSHNWQDLDINLFIIDEFIHLEKSKFSSSEKR